MTCVSDLYNVNSGVKPESPRFVNEAIILKNLPAFPHGKTPEEIERVIDWVEDMLVLERAEMIRVKRGV